MQRKLSSAWSSRSSFGALKSEVEFVLKANAKLFDDHLISLRVHSASPNESLFDPQMDPFSVLKWDHFGSPNGSISGPQMSPFRDPQEDPKRTTWSNKSIMAIPWGIARENGGLGSPWNIAQSPSHSLSHPSDGFATTPARAQCELP